MVMIDDPSRAFSDLARRIKRLENASPLGYSSVSRGAVEILSEEGLIIQGSASTTGTQRISGLLQGSGTLNWTGPANLNGNTSVGGNITVTGTARFGGNTTIGGTLDVTATTKLGGNTTISGNTDVTGQLDVTGATRLRGNTRIEGTTRIEGKTTLEDDLTLTTGGKITAGTVVIDRGGNYGGRVYSTGTALALGAGQNVIIDAPYFTANRSSLGQATALTLEVSGAKNFKTPHPLDPEGKWLRHGSTESPVSGIEYWDTAVIGDAGVREIELPDYFESLAKPEGRSVFVTGNGFAASWTEISEGRFTVSGDPGGSFSWLVKAERFGGDFLLEEEQDQSSVADSNSGQ